MIARPIAVSIAIALLASACARKRLEDRTPAEPIGEAGASSPVAGAAGESASGGQGARGSDDAGSGQAGSGAPPDASLQAPDSGARPDAPGPMPGIAAQGALPSGIWIGEMPEPFGKWSFGCSVAAVSSPRVTLRIESDEVSGLAAGTIVFGNNEPVPPIDPEREYPVGISEERAVCLSYSVLEGFPYTLRDGRVDAAGRFDFRVMPAEPYEPWCNAQASLPFIEAPTGYTCLPYGLPRYREMCLEDAECAMSLPLWALCNDRACTCFEQGCVANLNFVHRFDLQVDGDTMRGVISPVASDGGAIDLILRKVR